jgi:nucleoside-diphosphate-sugar epimerase
MTDELIEANRLVTVFGGSGFIGRHVVRALARRGWRVRVAVRRPDLAFHLQPLGDVGQIHAVQANLRYPDSGPMFKRPDNIDPKVLAALERAGVERVKLELLSPPRANLFTFDDVKVVRGDALQWLSWKASQKAWWVRANSIVALITMFAAIAAAVFSFLSLPK